MEQIVDDRQPPPLLSRPVKGKNYSWSSCFCLTVDQNDGRLVFQEGHICSTKPFLEFAFVCFLVRKMLGGGHLTIGYLKLVDSCLRVK